jgi:hypothetical protein
MYADRYARAINSANLKNAEVKGDEGQGTIDTDVLGAMGVADRALTQGYVVTGVGKRYPVKPNALAGAIARLLTGDDRATSDILSTLGQMTFEQSWQLKVKVTRVQADDIAKACYAWYRHGTCKPCGGHGKTLIPGTRTLSDHDCQKCRGLGKLPFETQFVPAHRDLARWAVAELGRSAGRAFDVAARKIAPTLDL